MDPADGSWAHGNDRPVPGSVPIGPITTDDTRRCAVVRQRRPRALRPHATGRQGPDPRWHPATRALNPHPASRLPAAWDQAGWLLHRRNPRVGRWRSGRNIQIACPVFTTTATSSTPAPAATHAGRSIASPRASTGSPTTHPTNATAATGYAGNTCVDRSGAVNPRAAKAAYQASNGSRHSSIATTS